MVGAWLTSARQSWRPNAWKLAIAMVLYHGWNHAVLVLRAYTLLRRRFPQHSYLRALWSSCIYILTVQLGEIGNVAFGVSQPRLVRRTLVSSLRLRTNDFKYGPHERHALDLFGTTKDVSAIARPVVVFIHGGAWAMTNKFHYAAVGQELAKHGILTVVVNYRVFPHGDIEDMLEDLSSIVQWTVDNIASHGGDIGNITLSGHSSGAHVSSLLLLQSARRIAANMPQEFEAAKHIKTYVGLSGPYDMDDHYAFEAGRSIGPFRAHAISPLHPSMHGRKHFGSFSTPQLVQPGLMLPPRILLYHGMDDVVVPLSATLKLAKCLRGAGTSVDVVELPCGHVEPLLALMGEDAALKDAFYESFLPAVRRPRWPLPSRL